MEVKSDRLSVLVIQLGARRRYELARMLETRGALAVLQTSTAWAEGEGPSTLYRLLSRIDAGIISRRTVNGIPRQKVRTTLLPEAAGKILTAVGVADQTRFRIEDWFLGLAARRKGLAGASVVLNTTGNGGDAFLCWAKRRGLRIASDIVITPLVEEILAEERRLWPQWEPDPSAGGELARYRRHMERLIAVSDLLLSPSQTVDDGLSQLSGFSSEKLVRVPYGLGATAISAGNPVPRRVLFAGHAGLRKGIPYLAHAAWILRHKGYQVRVAGNVSPTIRSLPQCADLAFLGHLSPDQINEEFRMADIFCLPSLAEGMASVTLEALASGVPCVVTRAAGSPVRHGQDGLIVPERDGVALAEAIRTIAEDRPLRKRMSLSALETAGAHRLEIVGDHLHSVLRDLAATHG